MRVFKATYKDRKGKTRESSKWYIEFRDHRETIRRLPAFTDKGQSEALGRMIERMAACRVAGNTPDVALGRWLESLSKRLCQQLCRIGLLDPQSVTGSKPLAEHVNEFEAGLLAKGGVEKHARAVAYKVRRIIKGCGFVFWADLSAAKVTRFLNELRQPTEAGVGMSNQTSNFYLQAVKQFGKWMVRERRASESPVEHLQALNVATDRRHDRRELSVEEVRRLLRATYHSAESAGLTGPERALVYRLAVESGIRANEFRGLTRASFDFGATPATVTVEAGFSKRRRRDTLPLRRDTAAELQAHLAHKLSTAAAFAMPTSDHTSRMIQADLATARATWIGEGATVEQKSERERTTFLAYVDDAGRYADFHALRHTFLTNLARSGVHPKIAQALARHSTITLTMDRYSHTVLGEQSMAVESLPSMTGATALPAVATGTDGQTGGNSDLAFCLAPSNAPSSIDMHSSAVSEVMATTTASDEETPENTVFSGVSGADGEGFEPTVDSRLQQFSRLPTNRRKGDSGQRLRESPANDLAFCLAFLAGKSADLALLVERWETLPDAIRAGIMAMVKASGDHRIPPADKPKGRNKKTGHKK